MVSRWKETSKYLTQLKLYVTSHQPANSASFAFWKSATEHECSSLAEYFSLRDRGLRQEAFIALDNFLSEAKRWPFERRKNFLKWYLLLLHQLPANEAKPHTLFQSLISPTLQEWRSLEPTSAEPLRWSENVGDLFTAIQKDPQDQIAIKRYTDRILQYIGYAAHELPYGYCGDDPEGDLSSIELLLRILEGSALAQAELYIARAQELRTRIWDYLKNRQD